MLRALDQRDAWRPVVAGLIALAWLTLLIWEQSPYGRYLDHGQWLEVGFAAKICRSLPAGSLLLPGLLYVIGWLLMTVAMMLPTILPLLAIFVRVTSDKSDRALLLTLVIGGYLAIWTLFGVVAHVADMALHAIRLSDATVAIFVRGRCGRDGAYVELVRWDPVGARLEQFRLAARAKAKS